MSTISTIIIRKDGIVIKRLTGIDGIICHSDRTLEVTGVDGGVTLLMAEEYDWFDVI